jgi:DnaK suppressor protein
MADSDVRAVLETRRRALAGELEELADIPRDPMATVSFGKRVGDGTTEAVERINRTAAALSLSTSAEEVERALQKLEEGTYGTCDDCGEAIAPERLEAIPWTALCVRCASERAAARR